MHVRSLFWLASVGLLILGGGSTASAQKTSPPPRVETTRYDSWVVTCREPGTQKKSCYARLRVVGQGKRLLLGWQIRQDQGRWIAAFRVPTGLARKADKKVVGGGIAVKNGLDIKLGNGQPRRVSYAACTPRMCIAEASLDSALLKELVSSTNANVTVHVIGKATIPLQFSIKGIDKAISALRQ